MSKFLFNSSDYEDIFQAGCVGLTRAAKRFNPSFGTKFSSYAVPFILGEIKNFFHNNNALKINRNSEKIYNMVKHECERFFVENHREPVLNELSKNLEISKEDILESLENHQNVSSIDNALDGKENKIFEESHEKYVNDKIDIRNAIENLSLTDKKIINLRFFESKTQSVAATMLGMTQVQVSRREKKILEKLRKRLTTHENF